MEIIAFKGGRDRNLSYIVHNGKEAIVIDPFKEVSIYEEKAKELNLIILGIVNTHFHSDHIEGNEEFEKKGIGVWKLLKDKTFRLADNEIEIIKTPGHSSDCRCFLFEGNLLTGDVLLAGRVGMAFKEEDTPILYESIQKIKRLPKETKIWPGHYYNSNFPFTLAEELKHNEYLKAKSLEEFTKVINKWREYMKKKREENI